MRLSLSGDGCGKSWPLCDSEFFPENAKTAIEWIHRLSSGLAFLFVFVLFVMAFYQKPKNPALRLFSLLSFLFILVEALIGALLVLKGWVALNPEQIRVLVLAIHSVNSVFLIGTLTLTYRSCFWLKKKNSWRKQICFNKPLIYFVMVFPLLALTGNIASLAGQLFPSLSLAEALFLDLLPSSHISLKIRFLHPLLALLFLIFLFRSALLKKSLWRSVLAVFFVVSFGFATLISLSPLALKLIHLFLAYFLWIFLLNESLEEA